MVERKPVPAVERAPALLPSSRPGSHDSQETMNDEAGIQPVRPSKRSQLNEKLGSPPKGLEDENGEPLYRYHFFDTAIAPQRKAWLKAIAMGTIVTSIVALGCLSIYWGALWQPQRYTDKLRGVVVSYDNGIIGQTIEQAMLAVSGGEAQLTWRIADASEYPLESDVYSAVTQNREWVGIIVTMDATARYQQALASVDSNWLSNGTIRVVTNEARNNNAYSTYIMPAFSQPLTMACAMFARQQASTLAGSGQLANLLVNAPQLVTQPINYAILSLRPFNVPVATAASYVGLIYLTILAFIVTQVSFQARQPLEPKLRLTSLLALRLAGPIFTYFFLSFFYSLLTLAYQAPFTRYYGHAGFVIFWMLSYVGMLALGGTLEAVITVLGAKFISWFLVLWIIVNVSVAFYPIDMLPGVFRYGYAMPFHHIRESVLALLLGTKNVLGMAFGVLIAWAVVNFAFSIPLFTIITRRQGVKKSRKALEKKQDNS